MGGANGQAGSFGHLAQRANPNLADPMQNKNNAGFPNARRNTMGGAQGGIGGGQSPMGRPGAGGGSFSPPWMNQGGAPTIKPGGGAPQLGNITGFSGLNQPQPTPRGTAVGLKPGQQGPPQPGNITGFSGPQPTPGGGNMPRPTPAPPGLSSMPPAPQPIPGGAGLGNLVAQLRGAQTPPIPGQPAPGGNNLGGMLQQLQRQGGGGQMGGGK